jgi:Cys-tRNA(Pro)/Cys-tRNA(Cys) deacylase
VAKSPAAPTRAVATLQGAGCEFTLHTYDHDESSESFGLEAADALGVDPDRVHKTLVVDAGDGLGVGIVAVARQLDLKAMAGALGVRRVQMAEPALARRRTGYVLGGISPLGQAHRHPTVLDAAAMGLTTIFVSGGRRGLEIELDPHDLVRLTDAAVALIAR